MTGDDCTHCGIGWMVCYASRVRGCRRIRYFHCCICGHKPESNKVCKFVPDVARHPVRRSRRQAKMEASNQPQSKDKRMKIQFTRDYAAKGTDPTLTRLDALSRGWHDYESGFATEEENREWLKAGYLPKRCSAIYKEGDVLECDERSAMHFLKREVAKLADPDAHAKTPEELRQQRVKELSKNLNLVPEMNPAGRQYLEQQRMQTASVN